MAKSMVAWRMPLIQLLGQLAAESLRMRETSEQYMNLLGQMADYIDDKREDLEKNG